MPAVKKAGSALRVLIAVLAMDQLTKYFAASYINPARPIEVLPFFHVVNVRNTGAAFGLFRGLGNEVFIALSVIAMVFIALLIVRGRDGWFSLTLILSGAAGNLIDRLVFGYVRDFADFFYGEYHWPAFNVADSALTIGLLLMLLGAFFGTKKT